MAQRLVLRTAIGKTAEVMPIWKGLVTSERIVLDLIDVDPLPPAFRRMVRNSEYDLTEMPVVTLAQAKERKVSITGIPLPVSRRFHHDSLLCLKESSIDGPSDIKGGTIAVRSYPQTSGVWVRGLLATEYGVPVQETKWVVQEGAHVIDYENPAWVSRASPGKELIEIVESGEAVAVAGLKGIPENFRTVIPDASQSSLAWFAKTAILPINHVLAVPTALLDNAPWLLDEIRDLFKRSLHVALEDGSLERSLPGMDPDWLIGHFNPQNGMTSTQLLLNFAWEQKLFRNPWRVEEVFDAFDYS